MFYTLIKHGAHGPIYILSLFNEPGKKRKPDSEAA